MKDLTDELYCDALHVGWSVADRLNRSCHWKVIVARIEGMQELSNYMTNGTYDGECLIFLWNIAFERQCEAPL